MKEDDYTWVEKLFSILGIEATQEDWNQKVKETREALEYEAQFEAEIKSEYQFAHEAYKRVTGFYISGIENTVSCEAKVAASSILLDHQQPEVTVVLMQPIDEEGDSNYFINFGRALMQMGILDQSQQFFIHATEKAPLSAEPFFYIAYHSSVSGNVDVAQKAYTESLRRDPLFLESLQNLAYLKYQTGQYESSISLCLKAIERGSEEIEIYLTLCACYASIKQFDECVKNTKIAYGKFAREEISADEKEAISCFVMEDYERALTLVNGRLNMRADVVERYTLQANSYMESQSWQEALVAIDELLKLDVNKIENLEWKFAALYALERWEEAENIYNVLLDMMPTMRIKYEDEAANLRLKLAIVST